MKVKCIANPRPNRFAITVGKVYEADRGKEGSITITNDAENSCYFPPEHANCLFEKVVDQFKLQMDYRGKIRIQAPDGQTGKWAPYQSIAVLEWNGKTYIAGSEYGLLPKSETVYEIASVATISDSTMEWIDSNDGTDHSNEK